MKFTSRVIIGLIQALVVALAALSIGTVAGAQPLPGDPPGRVARLSDVYGQVWLYNPDRGEWESAVRNRPLTGGDRLATDPGARACRSVRRPCGWTREPKSRSSPSTTTTSR
jgi:hypothetical protein